VSRLLAISAVIACGLALTPAPSAAPRKATRYAGETSQELPISFRVSRNRQAVRGLRVRVQLTCTSATLISVRRSTFRQTSGFLRVHGDRTFSGYVRLRPARNSEVRSGRFALNGRLGRRRPRGQLQMILRLEDGLRCDSGEVRFSARRAR
jgi:hypothetical protein